MDETQAGHERAVGDCFVEWYNNRNGTCLRYSGRGDVAPDLVYRDGTSELAIEITDAYYDDSVATALWAQARGSLDGPDGGTLTGGQRPERRLIGAIEQRVEAKALAAYGGKCILVVHAHPAVTTASELDRLVSTIRVPDSHSFAEIYLAGQFPCSTDDGLGGFCCWKIA